jgi:hypothetical protein
VNAQLSSSVQQWRTQHGRLFSQYFSWDTKRSQPGKFSCVVVHVRGNATARVNGGNNLMVTVSCDSQASVVCAAPRVPVAVGGANYSASGPLLHLYSIRPLALLFIGSNIPANLHVSLQTALPTLISGVADYTATHCRSKQQPLSGTSVAVPLTLTSAFGTITHTLCGGVCDVAIAQWPFTSATNPPFVRGANYSMCFFLPYFQFASPVDQREMIWDLLPDSYIRPAETRTDFLTDVCTRHNNLVDAVYNGVYDTARQGVSPFYFDGPVQPEGWWGYFSP